MKLIEVENYEAMSKKAGEAVIEQVKQKPNSVLGLATGGTPTGMYRYLVQDYKKNQTSYHQVHSVNLDEYIGLAADSPQSYSRYMNENLFDHINIQKEQTHLPSAGASSDKTEGEKYENLIASLGGIDLQVLGIGENGHIGFNEPGTAFSSETGVVELTASTREANARYFNSIEDVPTHAISMGIATIMKSRQILLLVSGVKKANVLYKLLTGEINEQLPASILKKHKNVTLIADRDALSVVKEKEGSVSR
ncbi:glucosamine-6-phosphate deaminase [Niallia sp. 03133]|uniref:glucosamine-6-phosphate deaminase n=1 Tax=Niallia sp. 03133 TaxID=3458060 RepID=UPI0040448948